MGIGLLSTEAIHFGKPNTTKQNKNKDVREIAPQKFRKIRVFEGFKLGFFGTRWKTALLWSR